MAKNEKVDNSVDMELVKQAWDSFNAKGRIWSPKDGKYQIRILPPTKRGLYFVEYGMHWDIALVAKGAPSDVRSVACLKMTLGQECPLCKVVDALYAQARSGDKEDKTSLRVAGKVKAKKRYAVNIVDVEDPKGGVKIWTYPTTGFEFVHPIFVRWGNVTDPDTDPKSEGQVLEVTFSTKDKYTSVSNVQPTGDKSPIPIKDWEGKRHDLDAYVEGLIVPGTKLREWILSDSADAITAKVNNSKYDDADLDKDRAPWRDNDEDEDSDNKEVSRKASKEGFKEDDFDEDSDEEKVSNEEVERLLAVTRRQARK